MHVCCKMCICVYSWCGYGMCVCRCWVCEVWCVCRCAWYIWLCVVCICVYAYVCMFGVGMMCVCVWYFMFSMCWVNLRAGGETEGIYVNTNQGSPTVWPQAWVWQLTGTLSLLLLGLAEPPWAGSQGRWRWVCLDVAKPWLTLMLGLPPLNPAWTCSSQRREPGSLPTF